MKFLKFNQQHIMTTNPFVRWQMNGSFPQLPVLAKNFIVLMVRVMSVLCKKSYKMDIQVIL